MSNKLHAFFALLLAFSMVLSACGAPAPTEAPVVDVPATQEVVVTEAPVAELDFSALFTNFWASIPADKGFGTVGAAKLSEELADKAPFLLDVRETAEVEKDGYIEGAVNIPVRDLLNNLDKLPGLDEPIVVYCASGHRGGYTLMTLKMLGYTNVRNLGGGLGAWKKAELPVVTGSLPAAPEAGTSPIVENEALFTTLNGFFTTMPDNFYSVKSDVLATELAEKAPFLLDVRTQAERDKDGYIEGTVHIPFSDFLTSLDQIPAEKDARIVIYCASGHRGAMAAMALRLLGYTDVVNLGGGVGAWKAANLPVAGWVDWATVMGEFVTTLPEGFYSTSADKLNTALAEGPVLIVDVREASEVETTGYIAGSVHIPVRDLLKNLDKLPVQDQKIVITCASGHRGAIGMMALRMLGYTDVVNLGGGVNAWAKASLPLEPGLPAEAAALSTPEVDAARFAMLDAYLTALPENFNTVKAADLNVELGTDPAPFVLDVRTEAEKTADGYIEGSVFLPISDLPASLAQLPADKAAPIVVTCKSGHRGGIAMMYLNFLGYTNVRNLAGGLNAWVAAELPVVK
ncbi:MAG TPA: rhodanese-like domain-containing protein [Anaerolineales bacterium]|nr:rhodanese-like domain-containing protein [Anaerolineales bacterium]